MILTRNIGQKIMIGDDITVTVLGIQGGQARIGLDGPREVEFHRLEIWEKIQREKEQEGNR